MKAYVIILTLFWQCCSAAVAVPEVNAADAEVLWNQAISLARQGQMDLAFVNFQLFKDTYPDSSHAAATQFSLGEYHFLSKDIQLAIPEFETSYDQYPGSKESTIALVYLYKIASIQGNEDKIKAYQRKIACLRPRIFIFKNSKTLKYSSVLGHQYKLVFYIDKLEVRIDDREFINISY